MLPGCCRRGWLGRLGGAPLGACGRVVVAGRVAATSIACLICSASRPLQRQSQIYPMEGHKEAMKDEFMPKD